jgi:opacity protein-like surface antigen
MKKLVLAAALAAFACAASAQHYKPYKAPKVSSYKAPVYHSGYVKKDGAYVQPHYQTAPDSTKTNNWSSKPNINPYTGKEGTKDPYATGQGG